MSKDAAIDLSPTGGMGELAVAAAVVLSRFANSERVVIRHDGAGDVDLAVQRSGSAQQALQRARRVRGHSVIVEASDPGGALHHAAIRRLTSNSATVTWISKRLSEAALDDRTRQVLRAVRLRPDTLVRDLPVLTQEELDGHARLRLGPSTPAGVDIDGALRRHGSQRPHASACVEVGRVVTYAELDAAATAFARGLAARVDRAGGVVALALPRSVRLTVAILGTLRAGVPFTATGPRTPPERARMLMDDARASLLVSDQPFDGSTVPWTTVDGVLADGASRPSTGSKAVATDPAYILFTSGSTGRPKGVVVSREALACYLDAVIPAYGLRASDRVLQVAEPGFDVLLEEILPTVAVGATVVAAGTTCLNSPADFDALVTAEAVTVLNLPSSLWTTMYRRGGDGEFAAPPACVRLIIVGSERVPASAYLAWRRTASARVRLVNAYGTTETTITSITCELGDLVSNMVERLGVVPIGVPLANTDVRVVDRFGDPPPFEVPGELIIGGGSVFSRYLGVAPHKTAEYRTGDLVCLDRTGLLAHLGRLDGQLKIRGHRIEPTEVESALEALPGVAQATCSTLGSDDNARLVAAIVPEPGVTLDGPILKGELARRLPDWLVPNEVMVAASLPVNDHGTVDRNGLRAQVCANAPAATGLTGTERVVADQVARILGRPTPAATDDFFTLGGNSLQAIRLVARLANQFGIAMAARQVFLTPTIGEIAAWLDAAVPAGGDPIDRRAERGLFPVTPGQRAMLRFLGPADRPRPYFEMWEGFWLNGSLDRGALAWALRAVVEENEALRTVVAEAASAQRVLPGPPPPVNLVDLSHLSGPAQALAVERELTLARSPFDLTAEPAFRPVLLRLGAEDHVLSLTMHHLFFDGWSFGVLNERLTDLYAGYPTATIRSSRPDFGDYAVWLARRTTEEVRADDLTYWRKELGDYQPVDLHAKDLSIDHSATVASHTLDLRATAAVEALATACAATPFAVLAALFAIVLGRLVDRTDLVFASNDANRYHTSTERMIGYLATTRLTRVRLDTANSFRSLVRQVHAGFSAGRQHMSLHWEDLLNELGRPGAAQFRFSLQDTPNAGVLTLPGLVVEPIPEVTATGGRRPVAVTAWRGASGYEIQWHSRNDLGSRLSSRDAVAMFARATVGAFDPDQTVTALQRLASA